MPLLFDVRLFMALMPIAQETPLIHLPATAGKAFMKNVNHKSQNDL
jgi:hypothetical protein